jgi:hypothetical protein
MRQREPLAQSPKPAAGRTRTSPPHPAAPLAPQIWIVDSWPLHQRWNRPRARHVELLEHAIPIRMPISTCPRLPAVRLGSPLSRRKQPSAAPSAPNWQPLTCCSSGDDPARRRHPAPAPACIAERGRWSAPPSQYADETVHSAR